MDNMHINIYMAKVSSAWYAQGAKSRSCLVPKMLLPKRTTQLLSTSLLKRRPFTNSAVTMSSNNEAVNEAQSRAQEAAKSDSELHNDHGDLHQSAQKVSQQHSTAHAEGSGMKQAAERKQDESTKDGNAKDQAQGVDSSSS